MGHRQSGGSSWWSQLPCEGGWALRLERRVKLSVAHLESTGLEDSMLSLRRVLELPLATLQVACDGSSKRPEL